MEKAKSAEIAVDRGRHAARITHDAVFRVLERFAERRDDGAPDFGALERALAELKPEAREIVHLYYYEGYRTAEIASVVGIGEGSVRSSLARSRRRIKKILEKEGVKIEV